MSGEQKYKEGDGPWLQWEASNRDELLVFTDRQQCYKARLSDFDDSKASLLGDFCPPSWAWIPARASCGPVSPPTTPATCCSSLKTARWPRWPCRPIRPRPAARSSRALTPTSPLAAACLLTEDTEMAVTSTEGPGGGLPHRRPHPQDHPLHPGVNVMTLKPKYKVADARPWRTPPSSTPPATGPAPCPSRACCSGRRTGPRSR